MKKLLVIGLLISGGMSVYGMDSLSEGRKAVKDVLDKACLSYKEARNFDGAVEIGRVDRFALSIQTRESVPVPASKSAPPAGGMLFANDGYPLNA